ncbi:hypothetical protein EAZG_01084 [Escherichia coli TA249]|nr:hypothetical protein EAZG_01084 [Escherichia coli TA249]
MEPLIFRVLSGVWTHYGAAAAQIFTVYENFSGKIVSVLILYNSLFLIDI